ncbi:MAG: dihydropteroate synthase [Hyphomicrobiales bacterium]
MKRPQIMGILNVTPDSFSDGGAFDAPEYALKHALLMEAEGADILDIGAESTRPGHETVSAEDECARLGPIFDALAGNIHTPISIDTYKAKTAGFALERGAKIINDVWGLQRDPEIAQVAASHDTDVVIMHNRFDGIDGKIDILDDMDRWFTTSLERAHKAGIKDQRIVLDPGIGFGKDFDQNLKVLANLDCVKRYGFPVLMGLSRKRFLGAILNAEVDERLFGTLSANLLSIYEGISIIRVHDVRPHREAIDVFMQIDAARS